MVLGGTEWFWGIADGFGWMALVVVDGFGWLRMISRGFERFAVLVATVTIAVLFP